MLNNPFFNPKRIQLNFSHCFCLASFGLGFVSILGFAPYFFWPLLAPIFCFLIFFLRTTQSGSCAFFIGVCYYLGIIFSHFSWGITLTSQFFEASYTNPWIIYGLSVAAMSLFFIAGLFIYGACFLLFRALMPKIPPIFMPLCFSLILLSAEIMEGFPYAYGFPWHLSGYALANNLTLIQLASVGSIYLISFCLIFICSSCFYLFGKPLWLMPALVLLCLWFTFGYFRLENAPPQDASTQARIRLIQANIDAKAKQNERGKLNSFLSYLNITSDPQKKPLELIIWPETATPYIINEHPAAVTQITKRARPEILTGALWRHQDMLYNSAILINKSGLSSNRADKKILVPYGEYWPMPYFTQTYDTLLQGRLAFERAKQPPLLKTSQIGTALILNCYENIFPLYTAQHALNADFIVHLSNEAWFSGQTIVRQQNFYIDRLRAVETGLPLIRVSNFGFNGLIDGYGRILFKKLSEFPEAQDLILPKKNTQPSGWVNIMN